MESARSRWAAVAALLLGSVLASSVWGATFPRRNAVVQAVEKVAPAVVNINTEETVRGRLNPFSPFESPLFEEFFRDFPSPFPERSFKRRSLGSGVIIHPSGYILTNEHVVSRATKIMVTLSDKREFEARLVGADPRSDLAVIKIESPEPLPHIPMGRSDDLLIGETVIAIGNPFGLSHTVTTGVISALNRSIRTEEGRGGRVYSNFIQLDASINPGNSGGPLLNINGELIGINTAIYQRAQGIGFAIPIDRAKRIVDDLISFGKVKEAWLGISIQELTPRLARHFGYRGKGGVLVAHVIPGSPAEEAGLRRGDIILAIGNKEVESRDDYLAEVSSFTVNDEVPMTFLRGGKRLSRVLVARELPLELASEFAREWLGLRVGPITEEAIRRYRLYTRSGVLIEEVYRGSPSGKVGLLPGDVIRQMNQQVIKDMDDFKRAMVKARLFRSVLLLVQRRTDGYYLTLEP
ncbi:MAG: Do family serine endopeptidase [Nitrospinota bacterium]